MGTDELGGAVWAKSSRSGNNGNCVEVAFLGEGRVALRDNAKLAIEPGEHHQANVLNHG